MGLPLAVDAQILAGIALLPEADLQQQAAAGVVGGQAGGFHPVQRQLLESELHDRRDGLAHEALTGVPLAVPIADSGGQRGRQSGRKRVGTIVALQVSGRSFNNNIYTNETYDKRKLALA